MHRYKVELPSGIIKNPVLKTAGCDFKVNDVVVKEGEIVFPMYREDQKMYGIVAARGIKGGQVLIATHGASFGFKEFILRNQENAKD